MSDDFMDQLDQDYAPGWRPEPRDIAHGIITSISRRTHEKIGEYPILTIRIIRGPRGEEQLSNQEMAVHCTSTVLSQWVGEIEPARGDRVAIRYNGRKVAPKTEREYHDWSRTHQRAAEVPAHLRLTAAAPSAREEKAAADDMPF